MFTLFLTLLTLEETIARIRITFFTPTHPPVAVFMKPVTHLLLIFYLFISYGSFVYYWLEVSQVDVVVAAVGGILFFAGVALRNASIRKLGPFWSFHVEIKRDHRLIADGPYAHLRHPYSAAVVLELCGFALLNNAWPFFFLTLLVQLPLLWYRAVKEEEIMTQFFQQQYVEFARNRGAFFPKVF